MSRLPTAVAGCGSAEPERTNGATQRDGYVLQDRLEEIWEDAQDCAADGMMCHEEMGHRIDMSTGV